MFICYWIVFNSMSNCPGGERDAGKKGDLGADSLGKDELSGRHM